MSVAAAPQTLLMDARQRRIAEWVTQQREQCPPWCTSDHAGDDVSRGECDHHARLTTAALHVDGTGVPTRCVLEIFQCRCVSTDTGEAVTEPSLIVVHPAGTAGGACDVAAIHGPRSARELARLLVLAAEAIEASEVTR